MNKRTTRLGSVLALALLSPLPACFDELPTLPGDSESTDSDPGGTDESATSTSAGPSDGTDTGSTDSGASTTDQDATSDTDASTTATETPWEGLFACTNEAPCDPWVLPSCPGDQCAPLDSVGTCFFGQLRARALDVLLLVDECEGCDRHAVALRGGGNDDVERQVAMLSGGEPTGFSEIDRCVLAPKEFFDACISEPTPGCFDPASWWTDCALSPSPLCSAP